MAKLVFRTQKITHGGNISASVAHAFRELPTPNANPTLTPLNQVVGPKNVADFNALLKNRLATLEIPRKDSPRVLEYIIGASDDYFVGKNKKGSKFFSDALKWLHDTHGKENVLLAVVHHDETTPHLSAFVVPVVPNTNKLSAKHFVGGKAKLSQLQTSCWEASAAPQGIERGLIGSKARHVDTNAWKAVIAAEATQQVQLPPPGLTARLNPTAWAEPVISAANNKLKEAAIKIAAANEKEKAVKNEAARLAVKDKFLNQKSADIDQKIHEFQSQLGQVDKLIMDKERQLTRNFDLELRCVVEENRVANQALDETIKALAVTIKNTYKGADLVEICRQLEVPVPTGKADIFDAVKKASKAEDFKSAVVFVAQQINFNEEVRYVQDQQLDEVDDDSTLYNRPQM
jgi:hypothetical protein